MARAKIGLAVLVLALSGCPLLEVDEGDVGNSLQWQDPPASEMNFDAAESYCEDLEQGGHDDWRLPSIDELRTLVDGCSDTMPNGACAVGSECLDDSCSQSACSCSGGNGPNDGCFHVGGFSDPCHCYASSSPVSSNDDYHWEVCFESGSVGSSPGSTPNRVRCVRGSLGNGDFGGGGPNGPGDSSSGPSGAGSGGTDSGGGGGEVFPATQRSYAGTPATQRFPATMAPHDSMPPSYAMNAMSSVTTRGVVGGSATADGGGSCGDGSAFICSPGGCCGSSVTSTPTACCSAGCCTDTTYCDALTGGCGYACEPGEIDCNDGACCPSGTYCTGSGTCIADVATCADGTTDCGDGTCCPSGTTCGAGSCDLPSMCDPGTNDCGDGSCCPNGSTCAGGSECEQPGCDGGVQCGDFCCSSGDQCLGGGQCAPIGCLDDENDCGSGNCCPSGTLCAGSMCMEPMDEPPPSDDEPPPPDDEPSQPPVGGPISGGECDAEDLLGAAGGISSGNACIDGCIDETLRCAGDAGCVLTQACADFETSCLMGCVPSGG